MGCQRELAPTRNGVGVEFLALGPLGVLDGERSIPLGGAKQRLLLAALLVHANEVVSVDRLADILWGDDQPTDAVASLQTYVSRLRSALEPGRPAGDVATALLTRAPGYMLRVDPELFDAARFERLLGDARDAGATGEAARVAEIVDEALRLWSGPALAEFADHDFARAEALRLEELRRVALDERVQANLALGRHAELIGELEATVAADPLRERPRGQLMLALYRCGRQAEALRAYQDYRRSLGEELGIEPSPTLQQLESKILQQSSELDLGAAPATAAVAAAPSGATTGSAPVPFPIADRSRGARLWEHDRESSPGAAARPPSLARPAVEVARDRPPALIGRRLELSWLLARLDATMGGAAQLVLLEGEAGIGKTRLAEELLTEARRSGAKVFIGRCYEQLDLAYLPLRESLFAAVADFVERRSGDSEEVALIRRIAGLADADDSHVRDSDDSQRTRQLLALTHFVLEYTRHEPSVVFVDDLDWADAATVELFRHVLFRLAETDAPLLLLATSRADPEARAASAIAKLRREPRCASVLLHPLSELESTELAHALTDGGSVDEARQLAVVGNGNPLLIQTLARDHVSGTSVTVGRSDDHPMTTAIATRLGALGETARAVVEAAAFLMPRCTRLQLAAVTGCDAADLDAALRESAEAGVLTGDAASLTFKHPLFQHAVYERTPELSRHHLHGQIATVLLENLDMSEQVSVRAIAHHLVAAGAEADPGLVVEHATRAGDEAMALAAWSEAARFYEGALAATDERGAPLPAAALHRLAALGCIFDLHARRAIEHIDQALELCGPDGDLETLADLYVWRIRCGVGGQDLADVAIGSEPLERLVPDLEAVAPALATDALVELAQLYWIRRDLGRAEEAARRAMDLGARVDHHVGVARATVTLSVPQWMRYELRESLATLERGLVHSRAGGDEAALTGPIMRLPLVLTWLGRFDEAEARALEACALTDRLSYPVQEALPLTALAQLATARGDFDGAERHAHQALLIQRLSGWNYAAGLFLATLVTAYVARRRYDAALEALDTWSETGDATERATIAIFRRYVSAISGVTPTDDVDLPRLPRALWLGGEGWAAAMVEIASRGGEGIDVQRAHDLLAEADRRGAVLTGSLVMLVPRVLGVAADLLGDEERAVETLERAITVSRALGAEPECARAMTDLGEILLRRGDNDRARDLLGTAGTTFERLRMGPDLDRVDELLGARKERIGDREVPAAISSVVLVATPAVSAGTAETLNASQRREQSRRLRDIVMLTFATHGGRDASEGADPDRLIGVFPSVERAIAAANRCVRDAPTSGLHLQLAIHSGDVVIDAGRISGAAVDLAVHVAALAHSDEVLVTDAVRELARTSTIATFVDRGDHLVAGAAAPQRLHALVEAGRSTDR